MRVAGPVVLVCALLPPCAALAQPGGPVEAAVKFFEAATANRCADVWPLYSAGTQADIREEVRHRERQREGASGNERPEAMHCSLPYLGKYTKGSARLVRQQGDQAVVSGEVAAKVSSGRYEIVLRPNKVWAEEIRLVRERGTWLVDLPRIKAEERSGITEVGPVDVRYVPGGGGGMHSTLEATAVVPALRVRLATALSDSKYWARAFPSVKAVESLGREGELERVRLTFTDADRSIVILVRPVSVSGDPKLPKTAVAWDVEGGQRAEPYARGSWTLNPYSDGTRITLKVVFDPRPWPKGVGTQVFTVEQAAQAVLGLEKTALR